LNQSMWTWCWFCRLNHSRYTWCWFCRNMVPMVAGLHRFYCIMNTITFFCNFIWAWSRWSLRILPVMDLKLMQSLYATWEKLILCIKRTQPTNYHFATGILLDCLDKMLRQTMNIYDGILRTWRVISICPHTQIMKRKC
jgi:hypothetical protein